MTAATNNSSRARPLKMANKMLTPVAPTMRPAVGPIAYTPIFAGLGLNTLLRRVAP